MLDVAATLKGKRILFIGATGFVGKVALSMLLRRYPDIGKMYVLVRPGAGSSAEDRFFRKVAGSPVFDPLREVWGDESGGFDAFLREKVVPLAGDIARPMLDFTGEDEEVAGYFPRREELVDPVRGAGTANDGFSVEGEIQDCERLIEQVRQRADDRAHLSMFREKAAARLRDEGRDADSEQTLKI